MNGDHRQARAERRHSALLTTSATLTKSSLPKASMPTKSAAISLHDAAQSLHQIEARPPWISAGRCASIAREFENHIGD